MSAAGCGRERGNWGSTAAGRQQVGPAAQCRAARFKLGFKPIQNIQMVQMKFEFLQILAGSNDTSALSKNLK
jgi:hypothetical protein